MFTLHVVSHTHWDREWYLPFQRFRFRLVGLVEELLDILDADPAYLHFTLDGQAVVLEDVLEVRPDLESTLRRQVRDGRILIGPWFILPDEFLVSPEALVRNLLLGLRICRAWQATGPGGAEPPPGYLPDTFGHISQMPQLLRGFGIETAIFARGAGDAPVEFRWAAPDRSEVLVCYLRDHYDNAALLPTDEAGAVQVLAQARDSLAAHSAASHLLMMRGSDHTRPRPDLPRLLAAADAALPDRVVHSSLPSYVAAVRAELGAEGLSRLALRKGEMRDSSRSPILPGVLSARMWIKQRNHSCQSLLERWAEPFEAFLSLEVGDSSLHHHTRRAWRTLLENHPHDSICGCSVDQVHREMVVRFDWCEQIGEEVARRVLEGLASAVDGGDGPLPVVVVFNPASAARTDRVVAQVIPPVDPREVVLLGPDGEPVPFCVVSQTVRSEMALTLGRATMQQMLAEVGASGGVMWGEWQVRGLQAWASGEVGHVTVAVTRASGPRGAGLPQGDLARLRTLLADQAVAEYRVRVREDEGLEVSFVAQEVPPLGYAVHRFTPATDRAPVAGPAMGSGSPDLAIENEWLRVQADPQTGLLTVTDKETGWSVHGCNRFVDEGDRGDEYNACPPEEGVVIDAPAEAPSIERQAGPLDQSLVVRLHYEVPRGLDPDRRSARSEERVALPITVRVTLTPGVRRVDFATTVENRASDHRLRVHFPFPSAVESAFAEGHWDVTQWPLELPADTAGWAEQPAETRPQRGWTSLSDGTTGVTVANRGLPEVEVLRTADGVEVALTLLRCVGWLSRDDLPCRPGHAGPGLAVPEAQCLGQHTFHYALIPHRGDWRAAFALAEAFQSDLRAVSAPAGPGRLPPRLSFVRVEPDALRVSAVRLPEQGAGLILRLWNIEDRPVVGTVRLWRSFARAVRTGMDEEATGQAQELARDTDTVALTLRGREVVTLRLAF